VSMRLRSRDSADLYNFNTETGQTKLLTFDSPGNVAGWILDRNKVPRVAVRDEERVGKEVFTKRNVWLRSGENGKWEKIHEYKTSWGHPYESDVLTPIAFDYDNTTLYVSTTIGGRDKRAVYKYDTNTKKLGELVFEHPLIDAGAELLFSAEKKKLVGIRYSAEMPTTKWLDPELDTLQKQLDATLPGNVNQIGVVEEKTKRLLLTSVSPVNAGEYFLFDNEKKAIEPLVKRRDWLPANLMSDRKFIKYKARDGMEIPAWVTIPKGSNGKNLPLIVNPHGGPIGPRDNWAFNPEAQLLASRGHAVLQINYRGSSGYGRGFQDAGHMQWGQGIQNDIIDATQWTIANGYADKNRVCIYGGSFGGYSAMMAPIRAPGVFKCAFGYVGVYDVDVMFKKGDIPARESGLRYLRRTHGTDPASWAQNSPAKRAGEIRIPTFLAAGARDMRAPPEQTEIMEKALIAAGNPPEGMIIQSGEMHGFYDVKNRVNLYTQMLDFFQRHLGGNSPASP